MKRSEVVKILSGWAAPEVLRDNYGNDYQQWADDLLHTLTEELKMGPPLITVNKDSYNREKGRMGWDIHEWEDEDEKV